MSYTQRMSEKILVVGVIDPDAYTQSATTYKTGAIDMSLHRRVLFVVQVGEMAATSTVDFAVYGDTASNGSFATKLTGKEITRLTQAGTDSDKQALVEVTAEEVFAQGKRYIRGDLLVGTAASDAAVIALAMHSRYQPGADLSSVDEIVAN